MEVKLGEAPSSKKEDEVKAVQLVGVDLRLNLLLLRRHGLYTSAMMLDK